MNLTLDAMAYDLWLTIRSGRIVDDDDIDLRQIKFWIRNSRAVWIKNELSKNRPVSQRFIQDVNGGCVTLERVDVSLCAALTVGCTLLRTNIDIPNTIEKNGVPTLTRVGPTISTQATYSIVPYERIPYIGNGRFSNTFIFAYWKDNRVYLATKGSSLNYTGMKKVNIRGVFVDPEIVPGYDATDDYPITEQLWVYLKDIIVKTDAATLLGTVGDVKNDSTDSTEPEESAQ